MPGAICSDNYFISIGRKIVAASDLSDRIIGEPIQFLLAADVYFENKGILPFIFD